jgi:transcriptional antiterminator NusG
MDENINNDVTANKDEQETAKWYVVHTYSGYENKVKADLEKIVENREMKEYIQDIVVPLEEVIEEKNGKRKITFKKIFPGYVIVKMIMTDQSWYVVRNTRGVTGFVGPTAKPVPLTDEEVIQMRLEGIETVIDFNPGDNIRVIEGPFENFVGVINEVYKEKRKVRVHISIFGRETPVELDYEQIQIIL